jgi:hypothetical protein
MIYINQDKMPFKYQEKYSGFEKRNETEKTEKIQKRNKTKKFEKRKKQKCRV